jgi:hypothetical protein
MFDKLQFVVCIRQAKASNPLPIGRCEDPERITQRRERMKSSRCEGLIHSPT